MAKKKEKYVHISCQGASYKDISELNHFQGELKSLSQVDYCRLKKEILELGFSEPVSVWESKGTLNILNGHQRIRVLRRMREDEGFEVPPVPINLIEAKDENEAKRKVLALTSQYGKMEEKGLFDFLSETDIKPEDLSVSYRFPELDIPSFTEKFFPEEGESDDLDMSLPEEDPSGKPAPKPVPVNDSSSFDIKMVQLYLASSSYPEFKEKVDALSSHRGLSNMSELIKTLVEEAYVAIS